MRVKSQLGSVDSTEIQRYEVYIYIKFVVCFLSLSGRC